MHCKSGQQLRVKSGCAVQNLFIFVRPQLQACPVVCSNCWIVFIYSLVVLIVNWMFFLQFYFLVADPSKIRYIVYNRRIALSILKSKKIFIGIQLCMDSDPPAAPYDCVLSAPAPTHIVDFVQGTCITNNVYREKHIILLYCSVAWLFNMREN